MFGFMSVYACNKQSFKWPATMSEKVENIVSKYISTKLVILPYGQPAGNFTFIYQVFKSSTCKLCPPQVNFQAKVAVTVLNKENRQQ